MCNLLRSRKARRGLISQCNYHSFIVTLLNEVNEGDRGVVVFDGPTPSLHT